LLKYGNFLFFNMAATAMLDFQNAELEVREGSRGSNCDNMPNFAAIVQTVDEIWRFFNFSRWRLPPS